MCTVCKHPVMGHPHPHGLKCTWNGWEDKQRITERIGSAIWETTELIMSSSDFISSPTGLVSYPSASFRALFSSPESHFWDIYHLTPTSTATNSVYSPSDNFKVTIASSTASSINATNPRNATDTMPLTKDLGKSQAKVVIPKTKLKTSCRT